MSAKPSLTIDVISDVVCPWCYIGQKRLQRAIQAVPELDVRVRWRPFQLDPTIPPKGMDRSAYMLGKFGSTERIAEIHSRIEEVGRAEGIEFAFDAIKTAANTLDAHRVILWAGALGSVVQNDLVRRLFSANFEQGEDVGDRSVLVEAAKAAGMDGTAVAKALSSDEETALVQEEIASASRMGVTGVPFYLLENKYAVVGAQGADILARALRQTAEEKAKASLSGVTAA